MQVAAQYVMSPPIRSPEHQRGIRHALAGQVLQVVATDHCPFNKSQKAAGWGDYRKIPNGVNGVEVHPTPAGSPVGRWEPVESRACNPSSKRPT